MRHGNHIQQPQTTACASLPILLGADYATHVLFTFAEVCRRQKQSFFVLFVDLVKAFDRVIRQLVFRVPPSVTDVRNYLRDVGLTEMQLKFVTSFVFEVMESIRVSPSQVCILHVSSWVLWSPLQSWRSEGAKDAPSGVWCSTRRTLWPSWR